MNSSNLPCGVCYDDSVRRSTRSQPTNRFLWRTEGHGSEMNEPGDAAAQFDPSSPPKVCNTTVVWRSEQVICCRGAVSFKKPRAAAWTSCPRLHDTCLTKHSVFGNDSYVCTLVNLSFLKKGEMINGSTCHWRCVILTRQQQLEPDEKCSTQPGRHKDRANGATR